MERSRRRRRWPVALVVVVAALLAVDKALGLAEPDVGHWRSPQGRAAYEAAYAEAMRTLPPPTRTVDVSTSFGIVRAYEWSAAPDRAAPPVVLLPGRSSGVPMWVANLAGFAAHRTVYALDSLGDAGLSASTVPLRGMADQAQWIDEALAGLGVSRAHVVGHSFGGASAAALAVHRPQRVASLSLLEPAFVLAYPPLSMLLWAVPASLPFLPAAWRDRALAEIGGVDPSDLDPDEPVTRMITAGSEHYAADLPTPVPLSDAELRALALPVYVAIAGQKSLAGGQEAVNRTALIPRVEARTWPDTTHSLPMQVAEPLGAEMEGFWSEHDE